MWRMDKKMKGLDLSEGQQEKYDQIRSNIEQHFTKGMDEHETMKDTFHLEMSKEDPDVRLMADMIKKKINDLSGFHASPPLDFYLQNRPPCRLDDTIRA